MEGKTKSIKHETLPLFEDEEGLDESLVTFEDEVLIANHHALGHYSFGTAKLKDGHRTIKAMNTEKVSEATTRFLQRAFKDEFQYEQIRLQAIAELESGFFKEYGITKQEVLEMPEKKQLEFTRMRKVKIEEQMNLIITKELHGKNKIAIDLHKFFEMVQIDSVYKNGKLNISRAIKTITEIQEKAKVNSKKKVVRIDERTNTPKIYDEIKEILLIPQIAFILEENSGFDSVKELQTSRKNDKHKYIKHIEITFDVEKYAERVAPLMNYVKSKPSITKMYKMAYTRTFDPWIRSLYNLQKHRQFNSFTLKDFNKKFDLQYSRYSDLKANVLNPIIRDFNKNNDLHVELKERYQGKKIVYSYFVITKKRITDQEGMIDISGEGRYYDLSYYIAVQHLYNGILDTVQTQQIDFNEYEEDIRIYTDNILRYEKMKYCPDCPKDKTFDQWRIEHQEAMEAFEKLSFYENNNPEWFEKENIKLSSERLHFVYRNTDEIYSPFGDEFILNNPIKCLRYYEKMEGEKQ